jgi:hypothetical protein
MTARKKGSSKGGDDAEPTREPTKKPITNSNDPALSMPTDKGDTLILSYWDLWFALVALRDGGGDLGRLADRLKKREGSVFYDRLAVERKRWHLRDLEGRLSEAGLSVKEVVAAASDLARIELRRALKRVLENSERGREWSEPMRNTPRKQRSEHARRGFWPRFPVSPGPYAKEIGSHFQAKFYSEDASFRLARTLDRYVEKADKLSKSGDHAEALALLRALMVAVIELMEHADDSCGSIGDSFHEGFDAYLKIPLDRAGIDESVFFPDLLDFLIWEDYGLTDDRIEGYFRGITSTQADLCIEHLRGEIDELRADDLEYESEEALTLLGQVVAEQERFDLFEDLAGEMGSREWKRVIRLADRAVKKRKKSLACQVFEAALTQGAHRDFLTKKYEQLKQGRWSPDPRK